MVNKNDSIIPLKSSEMLYNFLEANNLHKKDFAQMIGVTLSYVYNLIDETIPFRKQRLEMVDILRGARPIPLDWEEVSLIAQILDVKKEEIYEFWEARLKQLLQNSGFNIDNNQGLLNAIFSCSRDYIHSKL